MELHLRDKLKIQLNNTEEDQKNNFFNTSNFPGAVFFLLVSFLLFSFPIQAQLNESAGVIRSETEEELTIAFVPRSLDNPIFLDAFEQSQKKADDLGINLEWVAPFVYNEEEQLEIIEALIEQQVDGLIVSVNNTEKYIEVIDKALKNGVAVATFDADAPDSSRIFHVGINNLKAGEAAAEGLLNILQKENINYKDHKLDTMVMTGVRDAVNLEERIRGFSKVISNTSIQIKSILENQDSVNISVELLEQYLEKNPEVDIIYFVGGWPFYVPAEALPNFQKWVNNGGTAVGIDIFYDALLLQQQGLVKYLVGQDMSSMGSEALSLMYNYLKYDLEVPEIVHTGLEISDGSNIDRLLQIYQPWRVK
jgi:ribose transport system substrate-binding protein